MSGFNVPLSYVPLQGQPAAGVYAPFVPLNNLGQSPLHQFPIAPNQPLSGFYPVSSSDIVGGFGFPDFQSTLQFQPNIFPAAPLQVNGTLHSNAEQAKIKVLRDSRRDASGDDATVGIVIEPISTPYPGVYHRQYIVVNVVPGSDAAKNGIQVGDAIVKIEEFGTGHFDPVSRFSLQEMKKNLAGRFGHTVDLEVRSKLYSRSKDGRLDPVKKCSVKRDCSLDEPFRLIEKSLPEAV